MSAEQVALETIIILDQVRSYITPTSDMMYSTYNTADELFTELDTIAENLKRGEMQWMNNVNLHFLPTSTFQEHSIQNGWGDEYVAIAERFDRLYAEYLKLKG